MWQFTSWLKRISMIRKCIFFWFFSFYRLKAENIYIFKLNNNSFYFRLKLRDIHHTQKKCFSFSFLFCVPLQVFLNNSNSINRITCSIQCLKAFYFFYKFKLLLLKGFWLKSWYYSILLESISLFIFFFKFFSQLVLFIWWRFYHFIDLVHTNFGRTFHAFVSLNKKTEEVFYFSVVVWDCVCCFVWGRKVFKTDTLNVCIRTLVKRQRTQSITKTL